MDRLKGGQVLLRALPQIAIELGMPLAVTFAGDGPERQRWEQLARQIQSRTPGVTIDFVGWVDSAGKDELFKRSDLLVVPSLWPEPFGLVGLEAGCHGVPAVAFDVGGIGSWLRDGVNGCLAPGESPTAAGLAAAITRCLRDPETQRRLGDGAQIAARSCSVEIHMEALLGVFDRSRNARSAPDPAVETIPHA
jgi:glycosyltransferase involved in cell wall biosynthesis